MTWGIPDPIQRREDHGDLQGDRPMESGKVKVTVYFNGRRPMQFVLTATDIDDDLGIDEMVQDYVSISYPDRRGHTWQINR